MKAKKDILVFIDWFYPGYLAGGPIQSMVSMVEKLHDTFNFWVFTSDRDLNSAEAYEGIACNKWIESPLHCKVFYADPASLSKKQIMTILQSQDWHKVYINGLFSKYFSIVPLLLIKQRCRHLSVVVAPRGMFGAGALAIKRLKKKSFLFYAKHSGLHSSIEWHAASAREAQDIKKHLGDHVLVRTIANLPRSMVLSSRPEKRKNELKLFFSSRISPVKNVIFALEVLSKVQGVAITFHLYGLIEDQAYWNLCQERISRLPKNIRVVYKGTYQAHQALQIYSSEQVLFLPTLNENYGHSIVESLSCGCPVIISDQTPWKDLEEHNAGYALPLQDSIPFVEAIQKYARLDQPEFSIQSEQSKAYIQRKINTENIVAQYKSLFNA